jgi:hypothetical protein
MFIKKINMYLLIVIAVAYVSVAHGAAEGTESIHIWIRALGGQKWKFRATGKENAQEVKKSIAHLVHTPWEQQRLIFGGRQMLDNQTLREAGVVDESVLHVVIRVNDAAEQVPADDSQNRFCVETSELPVSVRLRCPFPCSVQ